MPRSSQVTVENNFTKGLITEASAMAFPENAVTDIDNCDISTRGIVTRRLGIDFEPNQTIIAKSTITANTGAFSEYVWRTVNNNGTIDFVVQQVANKLIFFTVSNLGISAYQKSFSVDLLAYKVAAWTNANVYQTPAAFANGAGYLYVTHPYCEPFTVSYDSTTDNITVSTIDIQIRDTTGIDDGLAIDTQPAVITDQHKYNLYNQGWGSFQTCSVGGVVSGYVAFNWWDTVFATYPSNCDVFWLYRNSLGQLNNEETGTVYAGNTLAPRGFYLFNAFNVNRTSKFAGATPDLTTNSRPLSVAFFAGRVWYTGIQDKQYSGALYFSQIVQQVSDAGKCYQNNDPTSEVLFDIVDTDGGVIRIAEAGRIIKISSFNAGLLVLADNGVWAISGSDNAPFTPTNYSVTKISDVGVLSGMSAVSIEGVPAWFTNEGIFTIKVSEISRQPEVVSITKDTIQKFFDDIPKENLPYAKSAYSSVEKRVIWLFNSLSASTITEKFSYNKMLVLNRLTGAFYVYTLPANSTPSVNGIIAVDAQDENLKNTQTFKFVTGGPIGTSNTSAITYSQIINTNYIDWFKHDAVGITYPSSFTTGYRVRGELLKKFQSNYLMVLTGDEASGSCLVQGIWDYSNSTSNSRYTSSQEVYRPDSTYNYHRCKLKIRGNGYSLQFKFRSNGNAPFKIIGWATFETGNNVP